MTREWRDGEECLEAEGRGVRDPWYALDVLHS